MWMQKQATWTASAVLACVCLLATAPPAPGQGESVPLLEDADSLVDVGVDELRIRLAPLDLESLGEVRDRVMFELRQLGTQLADAMVGEMELRRGADADVEELAAAEDRVATLMARKKELTARASVILAAVETKGGDVSAARGYLAAMEALDHQSVQVPARPSGDAAEVKEETAEEAVRKRVAELVGIVRAEPPAHERVVPWEVPVSELELELQPLPVEVILERLEKWRQMLQREVRKRVRIDILLNNAEKLKQTRARRLSGASEPAPEDESVPDDGMALEAIKSELAEQSQRQQRIINAIVKRMEVAIRLVQLRGGDASAYSDYIRAATGQKLNLTDPTILRAQTMAWLRSPDGGIKVGLNIAKFLGIVFFFWMLSRLLGQLTGAAVGRMPRASTLLRPVLAGTVRRVTFLIGLVVGVSMLGVNIGPLLAVIGAAGLVIGLALQGTLSNFASGILILLNRPYDVGDVIDAGGVFGKVEAMNLVSTSILTFDNQLMLVPNNQIWNGVIKNVTGKKTRRVDLTFGIGYGENMDKAISVIREEIAAHPKVHAEPAPMIKVNELGDSSVNIIARPWTNTSDYWDVYWDLIHAIKARLDAEGINIPYPQRDLHMPGPIEVKLTGRDGQNAKGLVGAEGQRTDAARE